MADMMRFTNVREFQTILKKLGEKIDVDADKVIRKIGFDLFAGFTERTPVDTGYARANWLISTNTLNISTLDRTLFPSGESNEPKAINLNNKVMNSVKPSAHRERLFITNSVPYIIYLEDGRTNQLDREKGYMVQRTVALVIKNIEQSLKDLDDLP